MRRVLAQIAQNAGCGNDLLAAIDGLQLTGRPTKTATFTDLSDFPDLGPLGYNGELNARNFSIPVFPDDKYKSDTKTQTAEAAKTFLSRVIEQAKRYNPPLSHDRTIELLARYTRSDANAAIRGILRRPGRTLEDVVRALELRFLNLVEPLEARAQLHAINRSPGEALDALRDRILDRSQMACRSLTPIDLKFQEEEKLTNMTSRV